MFDIAALFCTFIAFICMGAITLDLYKNRNKKSQPESLREGIKNVFKETT